MQQRRTAGASGARWGFLWAWSFALAMLVACGQGRKQDVVDGPIVIESATDLAQLRGVRRIVGGIELAGEAIDGEVELADLEQVDRLAVERTRISKLSLPALRSAGRIRVVDNVTLEELALPSLEEVTGELQVTAQPKLRSLSWPRLRWVSRLDVCGGLASLALPALRRVTVLLCDSPDALLTELSLPRLEYAETLFLQDLAIATRLSLPALTEIGGTAAIGGVHLEQIELPRLRVVQKLSGFSPRAVLAWDLPALQSASELLLRAEGPIVVRLDSLLQVGELMLAAGQGAKEASVLEAPRLARAGRLALWGEFEQARFPRLREVGSFVATVRQRVAFPELASAGSLQLRWTGATDVEAEKLIVAGEVELVTAYAPCDPAELFPHLREADRVVHLQADLCL